MFLSAFLNHCVGLLSTACPKKNVCTKGKYVFRDIENQPPGDVNKVSSQFERRSRVHSIKTKRQFDRSKTFDGRVSEDKNRDSMLDYSSFFYPLWETGANRDCVILADLK